MINKIDSVKQGGEEESIEGGEVGKGAAGVRGLASFTERNWLPLTEAEKCQVS